MKSSVSVRSLLIAIGAAIVGNLLAFAAGTSADATFDAGQPYPIGIPMIVGATVVPFLIGSFAFNRLAETRESIARWLPLGGLVFALVSSPNGYFASQDAATGIALAAMHVISGVAWFVLTRSAAKA